MCTVVLHQYTRHPPLGLDALSHRLWPSVLLYAFAPVPLIPHALACIQEGILVTILVPPEHTRVFFPDHDAAAGGEMVAAPMVQRCSVIAGKHDPPPRRWIIVAWK